MKVYGAPSGAGSLFQAQRSDAVFKHRVKKQPAMHPPKRFYALNDIGYGHKRYGEYAENNQYIFNFYRELFGVTTSVDTLLKETQGYIRLDPFDTSFWNFYPWGAIRNVLRLEWLARQRSLST